MHPRASHDSSSRANTSIGCIGCFITKWKLSDVVPITNWNQCRQCMLSLPPGTHLLTSSHALE